MLLVHFVESLYFADFIDTITIKTVVLLVAFENVKGTMWCNYSNYKIYRSRRRWSGNL